MVPNLSVVDKLRVARSLEFEMNDREARTFRSRLYAINKDGIRRYRTMRDGSYIVIWRLK